MRSKLTNLEMIIEDWNNFLMKRILEVKPKIKTKKTYEYLYRA
jgi:hypothetical protein